ncbi:MAG TPA: lytic transglycosylase, partial [Stenotrophomonas sp.]|nr:lytic transglycosylase [Stenotrophomonas sp.]
AAPAPAATALPTPAAVDVATTRADRSAGSSGRRHTVRSGESAWTIARRYGIPVKTLLSRNNLDAKAVLKPGMVLRFEESR